MYEFDYRPESYDARNKDIKIRDARSELNSFSESLSLIQEGWLSRCIIGWCLEYFDRILFRTI